VDEHSEANKVGAAHGRCGHSRVGSEEKPARVAVLLEALKSREAMEERRHQEVMATEECHGRMVQAWREAGEQCVSELASTVNQLTGSMLVPTDRAQERRDSHAVTLKLAKQAVTLKTSLCIARSLHQLNQIREHKKKRTSRLLVSLTCIEQRGLAATAKPKFNLVMSRLLVSLKNMKIEWFFKKTECFFHFYTDLHVTEF
jgi:hypothetical protein